MLFVRCAPGVANPLYSTDAEHPGCAPTIDRLRYETVKVSVGQPDRQGPTGIWVVTGWEMIEPAEQVEPPSTAEIKALVEPFLQARIAGQGADGVIDIAKDTQIADEIASQRLPLLYATSTGDPYERSAYEVVEGPVWPQGGMQLKVRLFAANGDTEVDQLLSLARDDAGRLRLGYDFSPDVHATTENGKDVPVEYAFLDGAVTYRATYPLAPSEDGYRDRNRLAIDGLLPDDGAPRRFLIFLAEPRPMGPPIGQPVRCEVQPAPADAAALARSIASDPDFEAAPPVTVTIGGIKALQIDVTLTPGARDCPWSEPEVSSWSPLLLEHAPFIGVNRARLFVLDLPGGSARVLALAVITDDDSFDTVLEWANPVINSIEFHTS